MLDFITSRPAPARSAPRPNEGLPNKGGGDAATNKFTSVLSGEKKSSVAENKQQEKSVNTTKDTPKSTTDYPAKTASDSGKEDINDSKETKKTSKSDDILALLAKVLSKEKSDTDETSEDDVKDKGEEEAADNGVQLVVLEPKSDDEANADASGTATDGPGVADQKTKANTMATAASLTQAAANQSTKATTEPVGARSAKTGPSSSADASKASESVNVESGEDKEIKRVVGVSGEAASGKAEDGVDKRSSNQRGIVERSADGHKDMKSDKVEVLESRRFMPSQNLSANGHLVARALMDAGDKALSTQQASPTASTAQAAAPQTGQTLHTLKIQLNPLSLGHVTAVLKLSGEDLSVTIQVHTAEAYRQLHDDNQSLLKSLRSQGYGVEQITIQHVTSPDKATNQQSQQNFQGNSQNPGLNDSQARSSSGGGGNNNGNGQHANGQNGAQNIEKNAGLAASSGTLRNDGVYL